MKKNVDTLKCTTKYFCPVEYLALFPYNHEVKAAYYNIPGVPIMSESAKIKERIQWQGDTPACKANPRNWARRRAAENLPTVRKII
eukprot:gene5756-224_t